MQGTRAPDDSQSVVSVIPVVSSPILPPQQQLPPNRHCRRATLACLALLGLALWLLLAWGAWDHTSLPYQHGAIGSWGAALLIPFGVSVSRSAPPPSGANNPTQTNPPAVACTSSGEQSLGSAIVITQGEWVCGNVTAYGADVTVLGRVSGNVQAIRGDVTVLGEVDGDVTALGGDVRILGRGYVSGHAQAFGGSVSIAESISTDPAQRQRIGSTQPPFITWALMQLLAPDAGSLWLSLLFWFFASLVGVVLLRRPVRHTRDVVRRHPASSLFIGVIAAIALGLASVALTMSFLGVPVAQALGVLVILAWVVGTLAVGAQVGRLLLRPLTRHHEPRLMLATTLGVLLLALLKAIPYVGLGVGIFVGALGLGAVLLGLLTIRRAKKRQPTAPAPSTVAS